MTTLKCIVVCPDENSNEYYGRIIVYEINRGSQTRLGVFDYDQNKIVAKINDINLCLSVEKNIRDEVDFPFMKLTWVDLVNGKEVYGFVRFKVIFTNKIDVLNKNNNKN